MTKGKSVVPLRAAAKAPPCPATTFYGNVALPFVIPTGA